MTVTANYQHLIGTPAVSVANQNSANSPVPDHAAAFLAAALRQINTLPIEQRLTAVLSALSAFFDRQAVTNAAPGAITFASGFRTIERSIGQAQNISIATAQTLGTFLGAWFLALIEKGVAMNAPTIAHLHDNVDITLRLEWRRGDRTLVVNLLDLSATFSATSFTEDRQLEYQEGDLDLRPARVRSTVGWLVGDETH